MDFFTSKAQRYPIREAAIFGPSLVCALPLVIAGIPTTVYVFFKIMTYQLWTLGQSSMASLMDILQLIFCVGFYCSGGEIMRGGDIKQNRVKNFRFISLV